MNHVIFRAITDDIKPRANQFPHFADVIITSQQSLLTMSFTRNSELRHAASTASRSSKRLLKKQPVGSTRCLQGNVTLGDLQKTTHPRPDIPLERPAGIQNSPLASSLPQIGRLYNLSPTLRRPRLEESFFLAG